MPCRWTLLTCLLVLWLPAAAGAGELRERRAFLRDAAAQTEELVLYEHLATALILRATLLTRAFRERLAEERRRLLRTPPDQHADFLARMHTDAERFHEVVFSAESPGLRILPTFGGPEHTWSLHLTADGRPQPLASVGPVRPLTALDDALHPHRSRWATLWVARFERDGDAREVRLDVTGGHGRGHVTWTTR